MLTLTMLTFEKQAIMDSIYSVMCIIKPSSAILPLKWKIFTRINLIFLIFINFWFLEYHDKLTKKKKRETHWPIMKLFGLLVLILFL